MNQCSKIYVGLNGVQASYAYPDQMESETESGIIFYLQIIEFDLLDVHINHIIVCRFPKGHKTSWTKLSTCTV